MAQSEEVIKNLKIAITEGTSISDYFICFDKALELNKILSEQHVELCMCIHEILINNTLKFFIFPHHSKDFLCEY